MVAQTLKIQTHTTKTQMYLILSTFRLYKQFDDINVYLTAKRYGSVASPAYNPRHPYETVNFDPAEADPTGNLTCVGDSYDLELLVFPDFNPNKVSVQKTVCQTTIQ